MNNQAENRLPGEAVIVPREPTDAMLQGACEKHTPGQPMSEGMRECPGFVRRRRIWADMIAAAPASDLEQVSRERDEAVRLLRWFSKEWNGGEGWILRLNAVDEQIAAFLNNLDNRK